MFNNDIANTLDLEIAYTTTDRHFIYVRYAVECGLKSSHTGGNTRRIKALIARLLDAAEEMIGDRLGKQCLFRRLQKLDGLTPAQRAEVRAFLGEDLKKVKDYVSDDLLNILRSRSPNLKALEAALKTILKGPLGEHCWGESVKDSEIKTAVSNVIKKMAKNLIAGQVRGGPLVGVCAYDRRKSKNPVKEETRGPISAAASGRYNRRKNASKKQA
jgi:hypothetical protein